MTGISFELMEAHPAIGTEWEDGIIRAMYTRTGDNTEPEYLAKIESAEGESRFASWKPGQAPRPSASGFRPKQVCAIAVGASAPGVREAW